MFILCGSNGKSTDRETLFALLGDYAVAADASLLVTNKWTKRASPQHDVLFVCLHSIFNK
jgi:phage/plasmid-associated DNA primase